METAQYVLPFRHVGCFTDMERRVPPKPSSTFCFDVLATKTSTVHPQASDSQVLGGSGGMVGVCGICEPAGDAESRVEGSQQVSSSSCFYCKSRADISRSALQQHPLSSTLYILISYHHLHPSSPFPRSAIPSSSKSDPLVSGEDEADTSFALEGTSPARTTLLLGLRLLPRSEDLWREYIKLELGWVEALRRRWEVLGIHRGVPAGNEAFQENDQELLGGEGSFGRDGEEARKAILSGQLVIRAISSALEAIPAEKGKDFREGLLRLLLTYPSPLRSKALDVVYHDLERVALTTGNSGPQALLLVLTKRLYDRPYDSARRDSGGVVLYGAELVEEVGRIGKGIRRIAKRSKGTQWSDVAGNWLATQIDVLAENAHLVRGRFWLERMADTVTARISPFHHDKLDEVFHASLVHPPSIAPRSSRSLSLFVLRTAQHRAITRLDLSPRPYPSKSPHSSRNGARIRLRPRQISLSIHHQVGHTSEPLLVGSRGSPINLVHMGRSRGEARVGEWTSH